MKKTGNDNINTKLYWDHIYLNKKPQEELDKKSGFLNEWVINDEGLPARPSKRFLTAIEQVKKGDRVLDIGCGFGIFTGAIIQKYPFNEVWGVDISSQAIEDNKVKHPDVIYYQQYVGNMDKVPNDYFDIVFSGEVLEHLNDPNDLFKDAFNALKSGGKFILTTPKGRSIDSPEHVWYFDPKDIVDMYLDNGFCAPTLVDLPGLERNMVIFAIGEKK